MIKNLETKIVILIEIRKKFTRQWVSNTLIANQRQSLNIFQYTNFLTSHFSN